MTNAHVVMSNARVTCRIPEAAYADRSAAERADRGRTADRAGSETDVALLGGETGCAPLADSDAVEQGQS